jgi:hypothetical protein
MLPCDSEAEIYEGLKWVWEGYKMGWSNFSPRNIEQYSRKGLTKRIAELLNNVITRQ